MARFSNNKITQDSENIAEALILARNGLGLSQEQVSEKLQISIGYIKALERGELEKLPPGIYGKNFLKKYANLLGISHNEILSMYCAELAGKPECSKDPFICKRPRPYYFLIMPKIIRTMLIILAVAICLSYLFFYVKKIASPPLLEISYPSSDMTVSNHLITVKGRTEVEADVQINGETVLTGENGEFSKEISLKQGLNTISVKAKKKYSKESQAVTKIMLDNGQDGIGL